jgi:hypothetical protein
MAKKVQFRVSYWNNLTESLTTVGFNDINHAKRFISLNTANGKMVNPHVYIRDNKGKYVKYDV